MKNKVYRVLSLVVAFALALGMVSFAAEGEAYISADTNIEADAGATVDVVFKLVDGTNVKNFVIKDFTFDKNALELVDAEVIKIGDPAIAHWMNGAMAVTYIDAQPSCSGDILSLKFKIKEDAKSGVYSISYTAQINKESVKAEEASIVVSGDNAVESSKTDDKETSEEIPEDVMTSEKRAEDIICLKIDTSCAFAFGNLTSIDDANDKVVPYIVNDRTLVPLRFVSETLGADVLWEDGWNYCYVNKGDKKIKITFGSADIEVNGEVITYDAPVEVVENRTMVPIRFISEELGYHVHWNQPNKAVVISPADNPWVKDRDAEKSLLTDILVTFLMKGLA